MIDVLYNKNKSMATKWVKYKDGKFLTFLDGTPIDETSLNLLNEIIKVYKIPKHLNDVIIVYQPLDSAHTGLVFKGKDSKQRTQYFYGKNHVNNRNLNRLEIIYKLHKVWPKVSQEVNKLIKGNEKERLIGLALFIVSRLFMRTGTDKYETTGLLSLKIHNVSLDNNIIIFSFIGKDSVKHNLSIALPPSILDITKTQIHSLKQDDYLFKIKSNNRKLSNKEVYKYLDKFDIRLKDIRTYGANMLFLTYYNKITKSKETFNKKDISQAIELTAKQIGHTKGICKRSYISPQIIEYIVNNKILLVKATYNDITIFLNNIVKMNNR